MARGALRHNRPAQRNAEMKALTSGPLLLEPEPPPSLSPWKWLSPWVANLGIAIWASVTLLGCASPSAVYSSCSSSDECGSPAQGCYRLRFHREDGSQAEGTLCTLSCTSDTECPERGLCIAFSGDPERTFICVQECSDEGRCPAPFRCTPIRVSDVTVSFVCLP